MKPMQCRMARAALEWTTAELGKRAGVGANTVNRFEGGQDARLSSVEKMRQALEAVGVIFVAENDEGPGVRLRKHGVERVAPTLAKEPDPPDEVPSQTDAALDKQIAEQEDSIAKMPQPFEASPEAAMATMDKAMAENDLVDMKNKQTRRNNAKNK